MGARYFGFGKLKTLVFLLEGESEKTFLKGFLSRAFALDCQSKLVHLVYLTFNGKRDLQNSLVKKIRGWRMPDTTFIVLQDQDGEDCHEAKKRLHGLCRESGKLRNSVVRIACRTIENWYLGDLRAVGEVYGMELESLYNGSKYRHNIDNLYGAEEMNKITKNRYGKIDGSRRISGAMNDDYQKNRSQSFRTFCTTIAELLQP